MFEDLTKSLQGFFGKIRGRPVLTEKNIEDGLKEVRVALLEADVHYRVVKEFTTQVTEKALGVQVTRGVDPAQQIVKIVHDEIEALMGPVDASVPMKQEGPTVLMVCGLQGSGKTTTCAKLALYLREHYSCHPVLGAADVQRPAAIDQLEILGKQIDVPVVSDRNAGALMVAMKTRFHAAEHGLGPVILDTAGRLHIDEAMMEELREVKARLRPDQIYLVADAMTGQDAVKSAQEFDRQLAFDGVILTKLDGDARGGAALSIKAVTGKPIKFVGIGEKLDKFEPFHPDRMADRILGMGDVVTLVEKAQAAIQEEDAQALEEKLRKATFDLEDFRKQIKMVRRMGPLRDILSHLPFLGGQMDQLEFDEKEVDRIEAIINSMTPAERLQPEMIGASRRQRIAAGSGSEPVMVNQLLKQFRQMKKMMRKISRGDGLEAMMDALPPGFEGAAGPPGAARTGSRTRSRKSRRRRR